MWYPCVIAVKSACHPCDICVLLVWSPRKQSLHQSVPSLAAREVSPERWSINTLHSMRLIPLPFTYFFDVYFCLPVGVEKLWGQLRMCVYSDCLNRRSARRILRRQNTLLCMWGTWGCSCKVCLLCTKYTFTRFHQISILRVVPESVVHLFVGGLTSITYFLCFTPDCNVEMMVPTMEDK